MLQSCYSTGWYTAAINIPAAAVAQKQCAAGRDGTDPKERTIGNGRKQDKTENVTGDGDYRGEWSGLSVRDANPVAV